MGWINLNSKVLIRKTKVLVSRTNSDVLRLEVEEMSKLGLTFLCTHIHINKVLNINEKIIKYLDEIFCLGFDCIGWCFPEISRKLNGCDNRFYPGIVVVLNKAISR